ncbi:MAG: dihydrofolate synthase/folylpolyglutamate synthase, partial [Planctomycetota bacterium]
WFDVLTASACGHFAAESVELAVIECGLGGRLDSTNIVAPVLTVLTRIELEHADMLGDSLAKIAAEKAGILAPGVPAIACGAVYGTEVGECLRAAADLLGTSLVNVPAAMFGSIGARNLALAGAALGQLGAGSGGLVDQDGQALGPHLLTTELGPLPHLPGRLERGDVDGVPVVLDGAHVPASLTAVLGDLKADPALKGPLHCIFGCGRDKDAAGLLKALVPWVDRTLCTRAGSGPHAAPADLAVLATDLGLRAQAVDDPASALIDALRAARAAGGWVLVIGSLHLVGALRSSIRLTPC